jgi:hypothetical protein
VRVVVDRGEPAAHAVVVVALEGVGGLGEGVAGAFVAVVVADEAAVAAEVPELGHGAGELFDVGGGDAGLRAGELRLEGEGVDGFALLAELEHRPVDGLLVLAVEVLGADAFLVEDVERGVGEQHGTEEGGGRVVAGRVAHRRVM